MWEKFPIHADSSSTRTSAQNAGKKFSKILNPGLTPSLCNKQISIPQTNPTNGIPVWLWASYLHFDG